MADRPLPPLDRRTFLKRLAAGATSVPLLAACSRPSAPAAPAPTGGGPPFKIGVLVPASGPYTVLGESLVNGMQLYFESVGNQVAGRPVQLVKEDEGASGDEALRKTRKLVEQDQVDLLTGIVSTAIAYAVRDLVHETRTILVVSNAGGNDLTRARKSPYIFRTSFTSWQVSHPLGEWVAKNVARRVYVSAADYAFGRESAEAFKDSFTRHGGTIVGENYPPLGNTDYAAYLAQIQQARPEATFSFYSGSDAVNFVKQYAEFGLNREVRLTGAGFLTEQDVLPAQGSAALGAITSLFWALTLDNPENRQFREAYKKRFSNREPDVFAVQAYDTAHVIVDALNKTGGDTRDKEQLVAAIVGAQFPSPRGPFRFDTETHQVVQDIYIREVKDQGGTLTNVVLDSVKNVRDVA
jgi:branched-chain amino acid transport system substrate-binding protein